MTEIEQLRAEVGMWRTKCRDVQVSEKADLANAPEDLRLLRIAFIALDQQLKDTQGQVERYRGACVSAAHDLARQSELGDEKLTVYVGEIGFTVERFGEDIEATEL